MSFLNITHKTQQIIASSLLVGVFAVGGLTAGGLSTANAVYDFTEPVSVHSYSRLDLLDDMLSLDTLVCEDEELVIYEEPTYTVAEEYSHGEEIAAEVSAHSANKPVRKKSSVTAGYSGSLVVSDGFLTLPTGEVLSYSEALSCEATAYTAQLQDFKYTRSGTLARVGEIAVDPSFIPLGSKLYIVYPDGRYAYGYATAEDTGGAIKGNIIDLYYDTYQECISWGRRNVTVYVLN